MTFFTTDLASKAERYLDTLCYKIENRRVGTAGNRTATRFLAEQFTALGWAVECPPFDCLDWSEQGAELTCAGQTFTIQVSPYSLGCAVQAQLVSAGSLAELEAVDAKGKLLLVHGDLTREQLMPKNFPFYNPDEHKELIRMLEGSQPAALICATGRNPALAGGMYPFPLFEDGDFDIPSVYLTDVEGERLAQHANQPARLVIRTERRASTGCNVLARREGQSGRRVVVTAHIDAKGGTPGALDDGGGIVTLLLLAELLKGHSGRLGVELVAINGEDNYSAAGEIQYVRQNVETLKHICLNINIDGVGYREGKTAFSLYQCPPALEQAARRALADHAELVEGEAWYQGDHMVFVQNDVPALALTSSEMTALWTEIAHTAQDVPELVDCKKLVLIAQAIKEIILILEMQISELC